MSIAVSVRFPNRKVIVSKAKPDNKSDKVSPDLDTPTDLPQVAVDKISASLNTLLADAFALYLKTKNFHWHSSGDCADEAEIDELFAKLSDGGQIFMPLDKYPFARKFG